MSGFDHDVACIRHYELSGQTRIRLALRHGTRWHWTFLLPLHWYGWNIGGLSDWRDLIRVRVLWLIEVEHTLDANAVFVVEDPSHDH